MSKDKVLITANLIKFEAYNLVYEVRPSHVKFEEIRTLLQDGKTRAAVTAYKAGYKKEVKKGFLVRGDDFYYKGAKIPEIFASIYRSVSTGGYRLDALEKFFDNLVSNPSGVLSVEAFARFLEKCRMPITDRGTFLAYKKVRHDYLDCHSATFDNRPGKTLKMPRDSVDHNQYAECSTGFHACSYEYLGSFGGDRIMVIEISPKDVVAVPPGYNHTKMRVCEYTVLCSLDDFKKILLDRSQDVLGHLPFFLTDQLKHYEFKA